MYQELEKITRKSGILTTETFIAEDSHTKHFNHITVNDRNDQTNYHNLKITKHPHGAGLNFSIYKRGKRWQEMSVEIGKSDIEMLIRFFNSVELKDYSGDIVPSTLQSFK